MNDDRDPILDSCLEELLAGQTPPDLTDRIMQAWSSLPPQLPPADRPAAPQPPPVQIKPVPATVPPTKPGSTLSRASAYGLSLVVAASVVAVGAGIGLLLLKLAQPAASPVTPDVVQRDLPQEAAGESALHPAPRPDGLAETPPRAAPVDPPPRAAPAPAPQLAERPSGRPASSPAAPPAPQPPATPRLPEAEIIAAIDGAIRAGWQADGLTPAAAAPDDEFCDRAYRRLLGRAATMDERREFAKQTSPDKRLQLVDELVDSEEHAPEFARHWSALWAAALIGREQVAVENAASRKGLQQFLRRAIVENRAFDEVAAELMTARGAGEPGSLEYNGAANFLLAHADDQALRATAHTARVFLGIQIQCAQCHDNPADERLAQNKFWELNSFFRQLRVQRPDDAGQPPRLADADFRGDGEGSRDGEVFYEQPDGVVKIAYPVFLDGRAAPRGGVLDQVNRRQWLAHFVVQSREFDRAVVNRIWQAMLGVGFTSPVDDMGPHNPPSHPQLLDQLAAQFAAHGRDVKALLRWISLSEPFRLSRTPGPGGLAAAQGRPRFDRYYEPLAGPPTAYGSLLAMSRAMENGGLSGAAANLNPLLPSPRLPNGKQRPVEPPAIAAPAGGGLFSGQLPPHIDKLLASDISWQQKVEHLFLARVHRPPSRRELALIDKLREDRQNEPAAVLVTVWWALAGADEFAAGE